MRTPHICIIINLKISRSTNPKSSFYNLYEVDNKSAM